MTIDDIAAEVGIGKATLYGYFKNKQEVALAVIDRYHLDVESSWRSILESDQPASSKIRQMILARVLYFFEVANRHGQSLDECWAQLRPLAMSKKELYNEHSVNLMEQAIRSGTESGEFCCEEPNSVSRTIIACIAGLMPFNLSPRELASKEQMMETTLRMTNFILSAISADRHSQISPLHQRHEPFISVRAE